MAIKTPGGATNEFDKVDPEDDYRRLVKLDRELKRIGSHRLHNALGIDNRPERIASRTLTTAQSLFIVIGVGGNRPASDVSNSAFDRDA